MRCLTIIKTLSIAAAFLLALPLTSGCSLDSGVTVKHVKKASSGVSRRTAIDRLALEKTADDWIPVSSNAQTQQKRNPFRGFVDNALAENARRQKAKEESSSTDMQLPEQLYNTRDYKVVGVITGTADPKVYVLDPGGHRFVLKRGSLLGNNNGTISSIHREGIEVYERVGDKGVYIELKLYNTKAGDSKNIQFSLQ